MILELELAKTNRSKCTKCKEIIEAGQIRGIEKFTNFRHKTTRFYCKQCSTIELLEAYKAIESLINQLHKPRH